MRLDTNEYRPVPSEPRLAGLPRDEPNLLTPARRAALEALEREFRELLQSEPR